MGLTEGRVRLVPHNPAWARLYGNERRRLRRHFDGVNVAIEHIGSTAVPGLPAKPIIDMAAWVRSGARLSRVIRLIEAAGYEYKGEYGLAGRHFFVRGDPVTHHLHIVFKPRPHWIRWLAFRNYLRNHPPEMRRYAALKRALAKRFSNLRAAYTSSKTTVIEQMMAVALSEFKMSKKVEKRC